MIYVYIYNALVITKNYLSDHPKDLDKFLQELVEEELEVNIENSLFGNIETGYLGLWFGKDG